MMFKLQKLTTLLAALPLLTTAFPATQATEKTPLPLIIWHGLGDSYRADGLKEVAQLAEEINPGTYVHIIHLDESDNGDREATFIGNLTEQIAQVCEQLASEPILSTAPAVNALGFSQGGQFLRAFVQRCNFPKVRNLVTLGSQHNGIYKFQSCQSSGDWVCRSAEALLRFGRWSDFVQSRLVPAQYFRDVNEYDSYLEHSNFLADINNERELKKTLYKSNLMSLNRFGMFMFSDDTTAIPKESAWFAEVNQTNGEITTLRERPIYKEDWLGLRSLDEQGKLDFEIIPGPHMALSEKVLTEIFTEYFGPVEVSDETSTLPQLMVAQGT
ncbi:palmitoyl-protein thioesterase precursor [Talaromyces stipitatus ATCC 10500]|uniref:Palmitoyl-protein thioesterase 1 n=1 Tax=Talaromyces stipitatus (strain ATCC 10500 / CBS 375.48 / QM 6759 / NRRL 1006) TaxID=441959 RepID=B8M581_TALSN|nr:palmitoyl-protein thioesterase precursor [Talaromyces stipitatus ATCC 10500]XP_002480122.1 palmitoyl-protein thioesterase precursor [Talaromyces stipitatus ATCC 10500]EED19687.1 palmitoyl-protein thioesterase precursor [Talaromyces stipitatus ATCC 10500]EED19688.1 palmitoyl-protein thioesterase precursor [Talaromyces stipitatus ATCC 10500]